MWEISWANLLMLTASIPGMDDDGDDDKKDKGRNEPEIDALNWEKYVNK